jgi:AcrR family transcriptional regulator
MGRRRLDRERVVDGALTLADAEGLDAVTLARVAGELGVRPPSLYHHVAGRGALLREIALRAVGELTDALRAAAVGRSGAAALAAMAGAHRDYALAHPGRYAATVRAPAPDDDEHRAAAAEGVAVVDAVLRAWDLSGDEAVHAVRAVRSAVHGFVALESAGGFGMPVDRDESFARLVAMLAAGLDDRRPAAAAPRAG